MKVTLPWHRIEPWALRSINRAGNRCSRRWKILIRFSDAFICSRETRLFSRVSRKRTRTGGGRCFVFDHATVSCEKSCNAVREDRETRVIPLKRQTSDEHPVVWLRKRKTPSRVHPFYEFNKQGDCDVRDALWWHRGNRDSPSDSWADPRTTANQVRYIYRQLYFSAFSNIFLFFIIPSSLIHALILGL